MNIFLFNYTKQLIDTIKGITFSSKFDNKIWIDESQLLIKFFIFQYLLFSKQCWKVITCTQIYLFFSIFKLYFKSE